MGRNPAVNAFSGANGARNEAQDGRCPVCLNGMGAKKRGARFCSPRCRLLNWAAQELARALEAGEADGLRGELDMMCITRPGRGAGSGGKSNGLCLK
jgi:hypothetical protein